MEKHTHVEAPADAVPPPPGYDEDAAREVPAPPSEHPAATQPPYPPYPPPSGQQQPPPAQHYWQAPGGAGEEIRIRLINPGRASSGFTQAVPLRLQSVARAPVSSDKWSEFIRELNAVVGRIPGEMATVAADFWLVSLVTLGLSRQACDRYEARVLDRAMELVERYNRAEFAAWGIVARLHVVAPPAYTSSRRSHDGHSSPRLRLTLELTVGPA